MPPLVTTSCDVSEELMALPATGFLLLLLFSISSSGISSKIEKCFFWGRAFGSRIHPVFFRHFSPACVRYIM